MRETRGCAIELRGAGMTITETCAREKCAGVVVFDLGAHEPTGISQEVSGECTKCGDRHILRTNINRVPIQATRNYGSAPGGSL